MNRRSFLKSLGAFAALAVVPPTVIGEVLRPLPPQDLKEFMRLAKTGLIENRTFYLNRGVVIDFPGPLFIRNCTFYCRLSDNEPMLTFTKHAKEISIYLCAFYGKWTKDVGHVYV